MTFSELMRGIGRGARTVGRGMMRGAVGFDDRDIRRVGQRRRGRQREQLDEKVIPGDPAYNEMGEVDQEGIDFGDVPGLEMEQPGRMDIPGGIRMPDLEGPPDLRGEDPSIAEMRRMGAFEGEGAVGGLRRGGGGLASAVAQVRRQGGGFNPGGEPLFDPARDGGSRAGAATPEQIAEVRGFRVPPMNDMGGRSLTETLEGMEKFPGAGITGGMPSRSDRIRQSIMDSGGNPDAEVLGSPVMMAPNLSQLGTLAGGASKGMGRALQALRGMRNPGSVSAPDKAQVMGRGMRGLGARAQGMLGTGRGAPRELPPGAYQMGTSGPPPNRLLPPPRPRPGQPGVEGPQEALPPGVYESPIRRMGQRMVGMRRSM